MTEQLITEYERKAKEYYEKAIEVLNKKQEVSSANTRTREDTAIILDLLDSSMVQKPLTAEQVLNTDTWNGLEKDFCARNMMQAEFSTDKFRGFPFLLGHLLAQLEA
ncbi:LOW QUALITY PROTEIN: hypothetical protein FOQG_17624 [Fusarium oxysporum f. sp. raphani 54005]|uniref:Uncharacterized protein n=1 Tax=Fusarium oxysporum f. sp. raphani 54005 TaxID=1089458 RepID=X0B6E6_FUSOX|nr:LOW QUALITY PROTEIN: hypothetical protein FOQG_17624 [Fusarium oxysporum f. sp. raphani 54005]